jgi:hypothetical protein
MNQDKYTCTECGVEKAYDDGCFNYPTGPRCNDCGKMVDAYLTLAQNCIDMYKKRTGHNGVKIDHGF